MTARKSCETTKVPVERSRAEIAKVLTAWGAKGVQWEDDFETGTATLRFRWKSGTGELVARLRLQVHLRRPVRPTAAQTRARDQERRRLHRVAFHWLRAQQAAVESGLFKAETVIIPWLEDGTGVTVGEALAGQLGKLAESDISQRLMMTAGGGR